MTNKEEKTEQIETLTLEQKKERQRLKDLETYRVSYQMYEKSKSDMIYQRKNKKDKNGNRIYSDDSIQDTLDLMNQMQEDVKDKYLKLGGNPAELTKAITKPRASKTALDRKAIIDAIKKQMESKKNDIQDATPFVAEEGEFASENLEQKKVEIPKKKRTKKTTQETIIEKDEPIVEEKTIIEDIPTRTIQLSNAKQRADNKIQFDVIPLPSNGECYPEKIDRLPVADLTAYDENMILSPNLYDSGEFLDCLVKEKVMTDIIDTMDLLPGDRDAIILWLRANGYGVDYPITATDNATGTKFDTTVDLTKIKYKPFKLKGDKNGWFEYTMKTSGDVIKFKFLSCKDSKEIDKNELKDSKLIRAQKLKKITSDLSDIISSEDNINDTLKNQLNSSFNALIEAIDKNGDKENEDTIVYTHRITDTLIRSIMAVNNITNREYIEQYVKYMPVKECDELRKYIIENEPGLDFNVTIERPMSLGGGSVSMFLSIDQYLFLNRKP